MKTLSITEKQLKEIGFIEFDNEKWCKETESDQLVGGWISFDRTFNFVIFFNGACIHCVSTFASSKKRLQTLFDKWNLEFKTDDNN